MKFVITETLRSTVIFKTIMVSLHKGRFVVEHLYSTFSADPKNVPIGVNLYQTLRFFRDFRGCRPTFLSQNSEIWYEGADLRFPPPSQIFYKSLKGVYPFLGKFIPKDYQFRRFWGL